jgi:RNA polymerase sigma-70 factor, ECF subfamily
LSKIVEEKMEDIPRAIIEQAQKGDIEAFEQIYRAASSFVYSLALRITASRQEAQEVTQDVFIKIYHHLREFQFRSSLKTWVYRIAANTAFNAYKRLSRERRRTQEFETVAYTQAAEEETAKELMKQEEQQAHKERLHALLSVLNPEQKMCIVLREIEGLSYQEISRALKININTVRSRLKRARQALVEYSAGGLNNGL